MSTPVRVEFASDLYPTSPHPVPMVEVANALDGHWQSVSYAERVRVRLACGPEYGEAEFSRAFGEITRADRTEADTYLPLDLAGKFVRITIPNEDAVGDPFDDPNIVRWYGVIERNLKNHRGNMTDTASGLQTWTAYGLLRVLDRVLIDSAVVRDEDGNETRIDSPRPFNLHRLDGFIFGNNRSTEASDGVYTFTPDPLLASEWTAWEAVRYLLKHHAPLDGEENPACNLVLRGPHDDEELDQAILSWYRISAETRGRSVKQLLDLFIPRTRGVGYWVDYEEPVSIDAEDETGRGTLVVHVFTFVAADLILRSPEGDDVVLPENPSQVEWDFDRDASVTEATTDELDTVRYDTIIVEGANITATGTFALDIPTDNPIERDWDDSDMNYFKIACSLKEGYVGWDRAEKNQRNADFRAKRPKELLAWRLNPQWNQVLYDLVTDSVEHYYWVSPSFVDESAEIDPLGTPEWRVDRATYGRTEFSNRDVRFLDFLTLRMDDQLLAPPNPPPDDSGPADPVEPVPEPQNGFAKAFVFGNNFDEATDPEGRFWMRWDTVPFAAAGTKLGASPTAFRLLFKPRYDWPGFSIRVDGGPQTMLGVREWTPPDPTPEDWIAPAHTDPLHNPINWGVAWQSLYVTATIDLGVPLRAIAKVNTPGRRVAGRTLRIYLQDARLDSLCPGTVVDITEGEPIQVTAGRLLRDDRMRIHRIATAAAIWYGTLRQQLRVKRKRVSVPLLLRLGTLIVRTGLYYSSEEVNTPVTAIDIETEEGSVTWETGYIELDLTP